MACIAKRRGRYVLDYYDNRGKRRWQTLSKGATLNQAKMQLRELENQLEKGTFIPIRKAPTFKQVAKDWLKYKKPNVRANSFRMYRGHVENHFGAINELKINHVFVTTVEKFITDRRLNNVSLPTIRKILITFGQVMKYAVRHRLIDHNPVTDAERPRGVGEEKKAVIYILKPHEIALLLDSINIEKYRTLFMVACMTGLRQGELFGLKWGDILWEPNQIHVQRTYNNRAWYRPKSKYSNRKVDIGKTVVSRLKQWKLACPPNTLDLVFPNQSGGPLDRSYILKNYFWPSLEAAGLPKIRFHDLRHSYASLLIDQGENIKYIQKQLGHSKPTVTLDIYAHLFEDENPDAAGRLDKKIFGSKMVANG